MAMYEAIKNFSSQFEFKPRIENEDKLGVYTNFVVVGMGGSHLAAGILQRWNPYLNLTIHHDYGLPPISEDILTRSLIIASSYSGNTEETLDAYQTAKNRNLAVAAVSVGGKLLEIAQSDGSPYVKIPDTGIQPRSALGFMTRALLALLLEEQALAEVQELSKNLKPGDYEKKGKELADKLRGFVPVIYSSGRNAAIAQNWKIKFNETGKIPAFYNVFPELNHNEMTGYDVADTTRELSEKFHFIFLKDPDDNPRILKRMEVTEKMLNPRGLTVEVVPMEGENIFYKIFSSLILADWVAYYTAENYGLESAEVPMVEEFKKLIA